MDLAAIGTSAVLSALLFVVLEFSVILPLFRKIVTKAVNEMVNTSLIPSISAYVDSQVTNLSAQLTKSIYSKLTGFIGGRKKGVNAILERLASGEALEDIEDEYQPSTIDKVIDIVNAALPYLPDPSILRGRNNAEKKEINKDKDGLQDGKAFLPQERI